MSKITDKITKRLCCNSPLGWIWHTRPWKWIDENERINIKIYPPRIVDVLLKRWKQIKHDRKYIHKYTFVQSNFPKTVILGGNCLGSNFVLGQFCPRAAAINSNCLGTIVRGIIVWRAILRGNSHPGEIFLSSKQNTKSYSKPINRFKPMFPFYIPWKHQKTRGFLIFPEGIKKEHLA